MNQKRNWTIMAVVAAGCFYMNACGDDSNDTSGIETGELASAQTAAQANKLAEDCQTITLTDTSAIGQENFESKCASNFEAGCQTYSNGTLCGLRCDVITDLPKSQDRESLCNARSYCEWKRSWFLGPKKCRSKK